MKIFTRYLKISLVIAMMIFIGCKKDKKTQIDPIQSFTLGVILPMDTDKGPLRENALRTAIDEINESGGVGPGYNINLMVKSDEGSNREVAAAEAGREIIASAPNLVGFITAFSSSSKGVIEQIVIPESYPLVSGSATASSLSGVSPCFSRLCPPDPFEATVLTQQEVSSYNAQFYDIGYIYAMAIEKALLETGTGNMAAFREKVSYWIRQVSHGNPGDPPVMPTLGWKSIKYACMNDGVDYQGASGNCDIDQEGNTITPYAIFRINGNPGAYFLEIISIVYP